MHEILLMWQHIILASLTCSLPSWVYWTPVGGGTTLSIGFTSKHDIMFLFILEKNQ